MSLEHEVIKWAEDKGIFSKASTKDQFVKLMEEVGEIAECINKGKEVEIKGELGDLFVTAIILADMYGYTYEECLEHAYNKISKRTGEMVKGVFVKHG